MKHALVLLQNLKSLTPASIISLWRKHQIRLLGTDGASALNPRSPRVLQRLFSYLCFSKLTLTHHSITHTLQQPHYTNYTTHLTSALRFSRGGICIWGWLTAHQSGVTLHTSSLFTWTTDTHARTETHTDLTQASFKQSDLWPLWSCF